MPPGRTAVVLFSLLASGVAEGVGIASLIPLIVAAGSQSAGAQKSATAQYILDFIHSLGLPTAPIYLLALSILGLTAKAVLNLLAMHQVGHAIAEVGTGMRMKLLDALLAARWGFFVRQPIGRFANAL